MCIGLANPSGMGNTFHGNYKIFAKKYKTSKKEIVSLLHYIWNWTDWKMARMAQALYNSKGLYRMRIVSELLCIEDWWVSCFCSNAGCPLH